MYVFKPLRMDWEAAMRANKIRLTSTQIRERMSEFEAKYKMSSEDFYALYTRGELDDSRDFMLWASLVSMLSAANRVPA